MASTPEDLNKWTVAQLKAELSKNALETKGVKADLVSRLTKFRQTQAEKTEAEAEAEAADDEAKPEEAEEEVTNGDVETPATEEAEEKVADEEMPAEESEVKDDGQEEQAEDAEQQEAMISLDDGGEDFEEEAMDQSQLNASTASAVEKNAEAASAESSEALSVSRGTRHQLIQENRTTRRSHSFYLYPISPDELDGSDLKPYLQKCVHIHYKCLSFGLRGEKLSGCLEIQMRTSEDVSEVEESLKNWKDDVRVVRLRPSDENICDIVADLVGYPGSAPARQDFRTLVIRNLPKTVKEAKLEELFPGCNVTLGLSAEGELTGNAFLEFVTIQAVETALNECKELEIEGTKIEASLMSNLPPKGGDAESGTLTKPLSLSSLKKLVNQAVKLRVMIATQWQETNKDDLIKQNIEKVTNLENRLTQNAALRRRRRLQDPDMWRRLRQDWLRKPSTNVDRNHQHLIVMDTKMLLEKLQNKTKRRQERQMEKQGAGKEAAKKPETKTEAATEEEKAEAKKEEEKKGEEEKGEEGKKEKKESKEDVKKKEEKISVGNRGGQNRRRGGASSGGGGGGGRYQREVQGRNLTVTVANNVGGVKRLGSRPYDNQSPYKRQRQDRSPVGTGSRFSRSNSNQGMRSGSSGAGSGSSRGMGSRSTGMMGNRGNYGNRSSTGSGNYQRGSGGYGGMSQPGMSMGGGGGMGREFMGSSQMSGMGMQGGMGNSRQMMGGSGSGGQDTSNALNLLVGLSQMLSKQGGGGMGNQSNIGGGSMGSYRGGSMDSGGYSSSGGGTSGFFEDRRGSGGGRMGSDMDSRGYGGSSSQWHGGGSTGGSGYGNRYGGSSGNW